MLYHQIESDFDDNVYFDYGYAFTTISFNPTNSSKHIESASPTSLHVYPNPAQGSFWVKIPDDTDSRLSIFDAQGRMVRETRMKAAQNDLFVERLGLSAGPYFLLFEHEDGRISVGKVMLD